MSSATSHLVNTVHHILRVRGWSLATAESLTGGLLCSVLTEPPGASDVVSAGLVAYSAAAKAQVLGIDAHGLQDHSVYSEWTARAMADGARRVAGVDVAVACTGVAGPGSDGDVAAGNVWLAVSTPTHSAARTCVFEGDRDDVRAATVDAALQLLLDALRLDTSA
ncbi:MAG: CinA family protein [Actinobacteria bacterium]|nr:CinA family protein [Actinomycetota bacterium]